MPKSVIVSRAKYKCADCQNEFRYVQELYRHKTVCNRQSKSSMCLHCGRSIKLEHYKCKECNRCFGRLKFFKSHQLQHKIDGRKRTRTFECHYCGKLSASEGDMQEHTNTHTDEKPFKCDICDKGFAYKASMEAHRLTHANAKIKEEIKCLTCHQIFPSQAKLKIHSRVHSGVELIKCNICLKTFSTVHNMKKHKKIIHYEETPNRSRGTDLSNNNVKSDTIRDKEISYSGQDTGSSSTLPLTGDKVFCCQKCHLKFSDLSSFLKHRRIHTGVKPYTCSFCNTGFCNASSLKQHVTSSHAGEEEESQTKSPPMKIENASEATAEDSNGDGGYKCVECDKVFFQFGVFNRHKMMHKRAEQYQAQKTTMTNVKEEKELPNTTVTSNNQNDSEEVEKVPEKITDLPETHSKIESPPRFAKRFQTKTLTQESPSHSLPSVSPKVFSCLKCGIEFQNRISLRGHKRMHERSITFTCSCGKDFSYRSSMEKHKKQHVATKKKRGRKRRRKAE